MKFKADAEEKEMKEICKRYAILGKTEEELLPVLKSTKAVSQEAYDQVIKTLNDAKAAVENSGTFSEIGKSGHAGASKGPDANSAEGKIVSIAKSYYASMGRDIDIIKLNGSIELAPIPRLADVIVEIVETGSTLRENGLKVGTEFLPFSARCIANKASYQFKHAEMDTMLEKLRARLQNKEEAK